MAKDTIKLTNTNLAYMLWSALRIRYKVRADLKVRWEYYPHIFYLYDNIGAKVPDLREWLKVDRRSVWRQLNYLVVRKFVYKENNKYYLTESGRQLVEITRAALIGSVNGEHIH